MLTMKFGVEIEFFGADRETVINKINEKGVIAHLEGYNHTTRRHWKLVSDCSVNSSGCNNGGNGNEIVSPILVGDEGLEELRKVLEALNECDAKVDKTCGLHVHHDASTFTTRDFKNLYTFMFNYKEVFDSMLPKSRRDGNNRFCYGLTETEVRHISNCSTIDNIANYMDDRYKTLNIQAYVRHGSIEFRQHNGSTDFEKISRWIELTFRAVCYAKAQSEADVVMSINANGSLKEKLFRLRNDLHIFNTPLSKYIGRRVEKLTGAIA